jgi:hypothetical protein
MFQYDMYAEYSSSKKLCSKVIRKCTDDVPVLITTTIYKYVISSQAVGSILDRKRTCRSCVIAVEKLEEIGAPRWACLHLQQERQHKNCICIHVRQMWWANPIVKPLVAKLWGLSEV